MTLVSITFVDKNRFMQKVKLQPPPAGASVVGPCWVWLGSLHEAGYGRFDHGRKRLRAHIVAFVLWRGPVPEGRVLDHLCRNRACTNPDHLDPVTQRVNILRGENHVADRARRTHCPAGHPYDEANTYRDGLNRRYCRACRRERSRLRRKAA